MKTRFIETFVNEFNMFAVRSKKESFDEILDEFVNTQRELGESRRMLANGLEAYFKMNVIAFNCDRIKKTKACYLYLISNVLYGIRNNLFDFYVFSGMIKKLSAIRENPKRNNVYEHMKKSVVGNIKERLKRGISSGTCSALYQLYQANEDETTCMDTIYIEVLLSFNRLSMKTPLNHYDEWYKGLSDGELEEREPLFNAYLNL